MARGRQAARERFEQARALVGGFHLRQRRQRRKAVGEFRHQGRERREPHVADVQRCDEREHRAQGVDQGLIRHLLGVARGAGQHAATAFLDGARELERQARLPDARLAADQHAAPAPPRRATPGVPEPFELGMAADERQLARLHGERPVRVGWIRRRGRPLRRARSRRAAPRSRASARCRVRRAAVRRSVGIPRARRPDRPSRTESRSGGAGRLRETGRSRAAVARRRARAADRGPADDARRGR